MTDSSPWTIKRLLEWTTGYLAEHGSDSPRLDAEVLLADARQCERIELYTSFDEEPAEAVLKQYREAIKLRAKGTPVAYLVGYREFYSLRFNVSQNVLIPRPETEFLVIEVLDQIKADPERFGSPRIVDVGTGSGAIAVTLATQNKSASVLALDISDEALEVARENAQSNQVVDQVELRKSDLLSAIGDDESFDFIVSNPPYVSEEEYDELMPEVKDHEPRLALVSADAGIELTRRLIQEATQHLNKGGFLIFETSPMLADQCQLLLTESGAFDAIKVSKDLAGHQRILSAKRM